MFIDVVIVIRIRNEILQATAMINETIYFKKT